MSFAIPGTFVEYGPIVVAAQRRRRTIDDLIKNTPADGLVTGLATVNGNLFGGEKARCVVMSYDYTVLAGTQGHQNHRKKDRMFQIARELRLPLVLFAEGGGGRPGDTDGGFHNSRSFHDFPKLSGLVPLVGITSGRCYAGNASLLGCCDVVIATRGSNIGMGGPAMIEGGGLGHLSSRGNRADGSAGAERRRRYRGRGRGGGGAGRAENIFRISRAR